MNIVRVPPSNEIEWLNILLATYPASQTFPNSRTVVCELHFDPNDILQQGNRKVLARSALPKLCLGSQTTDENVNFIPEQITGSNAMFEENEMDFLNETFNQILLDDNDENPPNDDE